MLEPSARERLQQRMGRAGIAGVAFLGCLIVLSLAGAVGLILEHPWLFPSLGPTAMLIFSSPDLPSARPLDSVAGHVIGICVGVACLWSLGLQHAEAATTGGLTPIYLVSAVLSVAVTAAVLELVGLNHPPAGASTLLVSLGVLSTAPELASMAGAVVLVTAAGWGINVLGGTMPKRLSP